MSKPTHPVMGAPNPNNELPPKKAGKLERLATNFIAIVIIIGALISLAFSINFIVLHPRYPQLQLNSLNVTSPFNLTSDSLSTSWDIDLTARNPNKRVSLDYKSVSVTVSHDWAPLGDVEMEPFGLGKEEERVVKGRVAAGNVHVDASHVASMHEAIKGGDGKVSFGVRVLADVKFSGGIWRKRRKVLFHCLDLLVSVQGDGTAGFTGPKQCLVIGGRSLLRF